MGQNKIVEAGHPALRGPAEEIAPDQIKTREIQNLIDKMIRSMRSQKGVGLAAPQMGVALKLVVVEDRDILMAALSPEQRKERERAPFPLTVLINPTITFRGPERASYFEGCLSVPGYVALVERALEVEVRSLDKDGEPKTWRARGWPARILQHEVDHLSGTLFVDRMNPRSLSTGSNYMGRWMKLPVSKAQRELDVDRGLPDE